MVGTERAREVTDSELSESIGALRHAADSLRDQTDRVLADLDGLSRALQEDRRRATNGDATSANPPGPASPTAAPAPLTPPPSGDAQAPHPWLPRLVAALALIGSVALVKVALAAAVGVVLVAAVLLQMRWWMPALAALTLLAVFAIESPLEGGEATDQLSAMLIVFTLTAIGLFLYEVWTRLRSDNG